MANSLHPLIRWRRARYQSTWWRRSEWLCCPCRRRSWERGRRVLKWWQRSLIWCPFCRCRWFCSIFFSAPIPWRFSKNWGWLFLGTKGCESRRWSCVGQRLSCQRRASGSSTRRGWCSPIYRRIWKRGCRNVRSLTFEQSSNVWMWSVFYRRAKREKCECLRGLRRGKGQSKFSLLPLIIPNQLWLNLRLIL